MLFDKIYKMAFFLLSGCKYMLLYYSYFGRIIILLLFFLVIMLVDKSKVRVYSRGNRMSTKARFSCYYSIQKLLCSRLFSKNLKIIIYKTLILPVVLYGFEIISLTLREEFRLTVFEKSILRQIFGPKGMRMGSGEGSKMRNFIVFAVHLI